MPNKKTKTKNKKTLAIIDAHALIHRAYHALPDFASPTGEPTGALYGLSAFLLRLVKDLKPDYLVACFDLPKPTFRHDVYENYKGTRAKAEDDLISQIIRSRQIFAGFGIPMYEKEGFEADDLIGTIVEKTKKEKDLSVIIASGDMDTLQLVSGSRVRVYTLKKGINETALYDEKAVLERFGFLPKMLPDWKGLRGDPSDNIIGIKGIGEKTATTLIQKFGSIPDIYRALKKDENKFKEAGLSPRIIGLLKEGKEEAEFSRILAEIRRDVPVDFVLSEKPWREGVNVESLKEILASFGFRSLIARLPSVFNQEQVLEKKEEIKVNPKLLEEMALAAWLLDSNLTSPNVDDILRSAGAKNMAEAKEKLLAKIEKEKLSFVYEKIEQPLIPILSGMEAQGILIDVPYLKELSKKYHKELDRLEKNIWQKAGKEFNINSPKQLSEVLFVTLGLSIKNGKKTEGGVPSTRASELEKLREVHPIIEHIISYREFQKLLSTYIDNLPDLLGEDGRLHTHFIQTGTSTGRLASQNPNLQNIPIRSELGRAIRRAFVATPGYELVAFDYSQVELRVAAILSGDANLKRIFSEGLDVHTATASLIFKVPLGEVTADMRRKAKVINFGILYGMGINALRQNLGGTREEAQTFYSEYFSTFTGLVDFLEEVKKKARREGFTETYFGRKRYFPGINSALPHIAAAEERMAINAPFQGTSADITKLAMVEVDKLLHNEKLGEARLLLQIHDELMYEVKKEKVEKIIPLIKDVMEKIVTEDIPIIVNAKHGQNWGEME